MSSVSAHDLISLAMYSLIIMFCVNAINFLLKKYIDKENLVRRMDKAVLHLTSANVGFQRYMRIVEEQSIINERNRITRELHDSIGYTLTNLIMLMEAAIRMKKEDFEELQLLNKKARDHAKEGFKEIRGALHSIRSMEMEKVKGITAIQKLITGGGPINVTDVLPVYVYRQSWTSYTIGYGSSIGAVMLIVLMIYFIIYIKIHEKQNK